MKPKQVPGPRGKANQTVWLPIDTKDAKPSFRIGFTNQRLTAHGGLIVWSRFLWQKRFRQQLREVLPHDPTDVALVYVGGKATLKLAVRIEVNRHGWREMLTKLTAPPNCHAVG